MYFSTQSGVVCRAANGLCDVGKANRFLFLHKIYQIQPILAETCDGTALTCPADQKASSAKECRPSGGPCDVRFVLEMYKNKLLVVSQSLQKCVMDETNSVLLTRN